MKTGMMRTLTILLPTLAIVVEAGSVGNQYIRRNRLADELQERERLYVQKYHHLPYWAEGSNTIYVCEMHPDLKFSEPGNCPRCGFELHPILSAFDEKGNPSASLPSAGKTSQGGAEVLSPEQSFTGLVYICRKHPEVMRNRPGKCPKCGKNLIPNHLF